MQVPLVDLKAQFATIRDDVLPAIEAVVEAQSFAIGPAVLDLEKQIAAYSGCAEAVGVSSGTDAILVSLMALGIGAGDEVIVPTFTFFATAGCVWRTDAKPVFADIDPGTFNIDPAAIAPAITDKTKAIIPVHLYGQMAEMDEIMDIADRHGLSVIEDAAQAIGATHKDRRAGSIGAMGCVSFYPTKNLGGFGDGGMILTQDVELAKTLRELRIHGSGHTYIHKRIGGCFRLDNLQAAVLGVKMRHLEDWSGKRREHAAQYDALLAGVEEITTPTIRPYNVSIFNLYVIRAPRRNELQAFLQDKGIGSGVYYPLCLHQQECFAELGYAKGAFPNAEAAADEVLALPVYPELSEERIAYVAEQVKAFYA